jgi:hypothetical protein
LSLIFRGKNFNFFQKYVGLRSSLFRASLICLALWIVLGFDSTPLQFTHVLFDGVPAFIQGSASLQDLHAIYDLYYGKEMHYSAFVIYFFLYWLMSRSWEKAGVTKSKNVVFSFAGMILAIAVFEWFWILSYAHFQHQPWVALWQFPQMRILLQNTVFTFAGGFTLLLMVTERYHWKGTEQLGRAYYFNAKSLALWICVALSIGAALLWIYFPGQITQISVPLETGGFWQSSRLFPQSLYTVDLNPLDGVAAGSWFYLSNDVVHALNTIVKLLWAMTVYLLLRVKTNP